MTTVGVGTGDLALLDAELLRQGFLQTGAVQGGEGGELFRSETGTDEGGEGGDIGRVEDHHDELHVRAVLLDVLAELGSDLAVALEEILAGHAFLTGCTTGGDDILRILESDGRVDGCGQVDTRESAVVHLGEHALEAGLIDVIQADVRREAEHGGSLDHVGANHTGSADDEKLFISEKFHDFMF